MIPVIKNKAIKIQCFGFPGSSDIDAFGLPENQEVTKTEKKTGQQLLNLNTHNLVFPVAGEKNRAQEQLGSDAAQRPHVDG